MVRHLVGLKATLTWNGVRHDVQRRFGLPIATLLLGWLAVTLGGAHLENAQHLAETMPEALPHYLAWAALILFVAWITLPVIVFPLDENLDPQLLAVLPISRNEMITGLAAASLVAPATIVPAVLLVSNARAIGAGWWMVLPSYVVYVAMLSVGLQLFSAAVSAVLRTRRGRDIATFMILGLAAGLFLAYRALDSRVTELGLGRAVLSMPILDWAAVLPPVAAQRAIVEAASGDPIAALLFLGLAMAGLLVLALSWRRVLGWMLTTPQQGSRPARRSLRSGMATPPWGVISTLARKELRFYVRDPRQRLVWTGTVIFVGLAAAGTLMGATGLYDVRGRSWAPLAAPILVLFVGLPIALNLFGWERNAASYLFVLPAKPHQLLLGKNAAVAIALVVETAILAVGLSAFTGFWRWTPLVVPLGLCAVACQLAVGNVVSVVTPLRLPREGTDVFAQSTEQGCLAILSQTVSFFAIGALLVPPTAVTVLTVAFGEVIAPWFTTVTALAWGLVVYLVSLGLSSSLLRRRIPEVMAWVQVT